MKVTEKMIWRYHRELHHKRLHKGLSEDDLNLLYLEFTEKSKEEGLKTLGELIQENNIPIPMFYWFNNEYRYKSDSGSYYKNELQDNGEIKSVQVSEKDYISNYKRGR